VVPALRGVRRAFPEASHLLAAPARLWPLASASGAVDGLLDVDGLDRPIPYRGRVDVAVNLHGRGPESHHLLLALRPARLLAHAHSSVPYAGPAWAERHEVQRWCDLLGQFGIPCDQSELALHLVDGEPVAGTRRATVIHPGAGAPERVWPVERWAAVAREERANGHRVVLTGSAAERPLAERVAEAAGRRGIRILAGQTDLEALMRVVAHAGRVLSSDTGIAHLAYAFEVPSVTLFGPVSPRRWGPPSHARHIALWSGREQPEHARDGHPPGSPDAALPDAALPDPGLLEIDVIDVLLAIRQLPAGALPVHAAMGDTSVAASA
jgi:hypothetical protein